MDAALGCHVLPPFDIFRVEPTGEVRWVQTAPDLKSARLDIQNLMAVSPNHYVIHSHRTNNELIVKPAQAAKRSAKPTIFQIAYDDRLMASRAAVLKAHGFNVVSAVGNEAAKAALEKPQHYDLFIIGGQTPRKVREEMADWLKAKYPKVQILALNPPYQQQLEPADYNVVLDGPEEWLFVVEASTGNYPPQAAASL